MNQLLDTAFKFALYQSLVSLSYALLSLQVWKNDKVWKNHFTEHVWPVFNQTLQFFPVLMIIMIRKREMKYHLVSHAAAELILMPACVCR